jgi:hypothetical protein
MSVRAYITAVAAGVATPTTTPPPTPTPPTDLPWHEPFDQANYAALDAQYGIGFPTDPYATVSGGALTIVGDNIFGGPDDVELNTAQFPTKYREVWMRFQLDVVGGDYDSTSCALQFFMWDSSSGLELDFDGFGDGVGTWELYLFPDGTNPDSGVTHLMPAGTHTFIVCASEDSPTVWRGELWIDAAPGDAPQISATSSKVASTGFDNISVDLRGPFDPARSVRFLDVSVIAGDRASDPFGIL